MSIAEVYELPAGRVLFSDEQGRVLRATWHLEHRLVNLSVWNNDRCTETFRLSLSDAAQFIAFLVEGMTEATDRLLQAVSASTATGTPDRRQSMASRLRVARARLAGWISPRNTLCASEPPASRRDRVARHVADLGKQRR